MERPRLPRSTCSSRQSGLDPETKLPAAIRLALTLPQGFPAKYYGAIVRAAESCKVKKTIAAGPPIVVTIAAPPGVPSA